VDVIVHCFVLSEFEEETNAVMLNRVRVKLEVSATHRAIHFIWVAVRNASQIFPSLLVFGMFVIVLYTTIVRYLPLGVTRTTWGDVSVRLLLAWLTFFIGGLLARDRSHLTLDVVVRLLGRRLRLAVTILADFILLAFFVVIAKEALFLALAHMQYIETTLRVPRGLWPLSLFAGAVLTLCCLISWSIKNIREIFQKK
jgi:TRAP-type C4-dicarboxylate transport system permease small subunit